MTARRVVLGVLYIWLGTFHATNFYLTNHTVRRTSVCRLKTLLNGSDAKYDRKLVTGEQSI
jgi:hypothetical protein